MTAVSGVPHHDHHHSALEPHLDVEYVDTLVEMYQSSSTDVKPAVAAKPQVKPVKTAAKPTTKVKPTPATAVSSASFQSTCTNLLTPLLSQSNIDLIVSGAKDPKGTACSTAVSKITSEINDQVPPNYKIAAGVLIESMGAALESVCKDAADRVTGTKKSLAEVKKGAEESSIDTIADAITDQANSLIDQAADYFHITDPKLIAGLKTKVKNARDSAVKWLKEKLNPTEAKTKTEATTASSSDTAVENAQEELAATKLEDLQQVDKQYTTTSDAKAVVTKVTTTTSTQSDVKDEEEGVNFENPFG